MTALPSIPPAILEGLRRYSDEHMATGGFLRAVLSNDLTNAVMLADAWSLAALPAIVQYVYDGLPGNCWGSREKYNAWISEKST